MTQICFDASTALAFALENDPYHTAAVALVSLLGTQGMRAFQIACDYDQPRAYDAAYTAHAEARDLELVTTDNPFFEALNGVRRPQKMPPLSFVKLLV